MTTTPGAAAAPKRLLLTTVTKGYRHESIAEALRLIPHLAETSGEFVVDFAGDDEELESKMSPAGLAAYDGVIFANTSGDLPIPDPQAFVDWISAGHSFIGIHAAADTFHHFAPYLRMLGAEFEWHGPQVPLTALGADPAFPGMDGIGASIDIPIEEVYILKDYQADDAHLLLYQDRHPNDHQSGFYPLAWARRFSSGRVFYTALGHRDDIWTAEWFIQHLQGGIRWTLGLAEGSAEPLPLPAI